MIKQKILVAEDDLEINRLVSEHLIREGYSVACAFNGLDAIQKITSEAYQMIILDVMMPLVDGFEVLQKIRKLGNIPVLILSAKSEETDKIIGLGLGADDYMTKPFSMGELTARVKAQLRRYLKYSTDAEEDQKERIIKHLDIEMDTNSFEVKAGGRLVALTAKEFEIFKLFLLNPKKVFTKTQLFMSVWGENYLNDENTVMVHIRRLREKIEIDPSNPRYIQTVWGIGYKMTEE